MSETAIQNADTQEKVNYVTGEIVPEDKVTDKENEERHLQLIERGTIVVAQEPQQVLEEARKAADVLMNVLRQKEKKVEFNGKQYLEFEDWQLLGRFYGVAAKVLSTEYVEYGAVKGFVAKSALIKISSGLEISGAEAMCLNDERNWKNKPLFQLRSMAQTRACSKSLRNILAYVAVLAGFAPTPAEEMEDLKKDNEPPIQAPQRSERQDLLINDAQRKRLFAICKGKFTHEQIKKDLEEKFNYTSTHDIKRKDYDKICKHFER